MKRILAVSFAVLFLLGIAGCGRKGEAIKVDLTRRESEQKEEGKVSDKDPIRIAVGSMITPREGYAYYRKLLDYIGQKMARPVKFVDRESYAEINSMIEAQDIDIAFVCGQPYVDGHREFGLELLVAPYAYGGTVYYSYIIAAESSHINDFDDLKGKTFAFTDPMSNTGKLVPTYMLAKKGQTPDTFFRKYVYTYAHDKSIKVVAQGIVDGAAVNSLVWEYGNRMNPEFTAKTKVIAKSPSYGITPVVVHPGIDPAFKEKLKQIFLNVHKDPEGRRILQGMMIDKFVTMDDAAYDSIREMQQFIDSQSAQ